MTSPEQKHLFPQTPGERGPDLWEQAAERDRIAAAVVFNKPLETAFHYLVPNGLREMIVPGQRVKVPFGRGDRTGF